MKPSELFEGENSSLRKTFDEVVLKGARRRIIELLREEVRAEEKALWLRSEIEKLEGIEDGGMHLVGCPISHIHLEVSSCGCGIYNRGYNQALTSIITRYKEELKVLESK